MANSQALSLRPAHLDDVDGITDLHTLARTAYYRAGGITDAELDSPAAYTGRREAWLRAVRGGDRTVVCAELAGELAGVLAMGPPYEADVDPVAAGQLYQIHVRPGLWGQGVGSSLHGVFVGFLRGRALVMGVLEAWERNSRAQAFYARHGWEADGSRRPGPGGGSYVRLRLPLRSEA